MIDDTTGTSGPGKDSHVTVSHHWAQIPEGLLYDPSMPAAAVRVYGVLHRHGQDPQNCYPSHARIAKLIGASKESVPGWIRQLIAAGWIERVPRFTEAGDQDTNGYRVHAVQPGVPALQQPPPPAVEQGGSLLTSRGKESNRKRASRNQEPLSPNGDAQPLRLVDVPADPLRGFSQFWEVYPRRDGKRLGRGKAEQVWRGLNIDERRAAWRGAKNYGVACDADVARAKDAHRWLRDRCWEEWQTPAKPRDNGHATQGPEAFPRGGAA